jgi:hypothetical protein
VPSNRSTVCVVIPWRDRPELASTLVSNAGVFREHALTVTIVNCGGSPDDLRALVRGSGVEALLVHLASETYNGALARNLGVHHSSSDYLFMLDADSCIPGDTAITILSRLNRGTVMTIDAVYESTSRARGLLPDDGCLKELVGINALKLVWDDGRQVTVQGYQSLVGCEKRSGAGLTIAGRAELMKIDGYNSQLGGWGFEDLDVLIRLQRVLDLKHEPIGDAVHLSHDDSKRSLPPGLTRDASLARNMRTATANSRGALLGTLSHDVAACGPRVWTETVR